MSELRLVAMTEDFPSDLLSCGVPTIDNQVRDAYRKTLCKQGLAYNIIVDGFLVGNCMVKLVWLCDENEEYYVTDHGFIALEISYIAIDTRIQKNGIGKRVLTRLMSDAHQLSKDLPIRFLIIDALDDKKEWYSKAGFEEYPKREDLRCLGTIPMRVDFIDKVAVNKYAESQI